MSDSTAGNPLGVGASGDEVRRLHATLRLLGSSVPETELARGAFGEGTAEALRGWQESVHLRASGAVDERTGSQVDLALQDQPRRAVLGRVTNPDGTPVAGLVVRLFDANLAGASPVGGTAITDADGRYELQYSTEQLGRPGKSAADLVVRAFPAGSEDGAVAVSPVVFGAGPVQLVPLTVAAAPQSAYEHLRARIEPALQGTAIADVDGAADLAYLAGTTGADRAEIAAFTRAAALAAGTDRLLDDDPAARDATAAARTEPVFFALARTDPGTDLASLLATAPGELADRVTEAGLDGLIPPVADRAELTAAIVELQARQRLRPADIGPASLGDALRSLPVDRQLPDRVALAVARLHAEEGGPSDRFFDRLRGVDGLDERQYHDVRLSLALHDLTNGDLRVIDTLQGRTPDGHDGGLAHLAPLAPNQWLEVAAAGRPDDDRDAHLAIAGTLAQRVEQLHPSPAFKAKLDAGLLRNSLYPADRVAGFLGDHTDFHLVDTTIEPYLADAGLADDRELRGGLQTTQRLLRAGAYQHEVAALVANGVGNLADLAGRDRQDLVALLRDAVPESRVEALHSRAQHLLTGALAAATLVAPRYTAGNVAFGGVSAISGAAPSGFPSLAQLFGDQSSCWCGQCRSVLSPAAYLVDLLHLLDQAGMFGFLDGRRPDLAEVELTCENTEAMLPYADLVLEILESAVAFPGVVIMPPADAAQLLAGTVPPSLRTELVKHGIVDDEPLTVVTSAQPAAQPNLTKLVVRNGERRFPVTVARRRMVATWPGTGSVPYSVTVPDADVDAAWQALGAGQVPSSLVALIAPEPEAPVVGTPTVAGHTVSIVRSLVVELYGNFAVGAIRLLRPDGSEIRSQQVQPGTLVISTAAALAQGRVYSYLANMLPPLQYTVAADATASPGALGRWTLTANVEAQIRYTPDGVLLGGLTYSSSSDATGDGLLPDHRDPEAYRRLTGAVFPLDLPFDLFHEEVRTCLAIAGTSRRDLLRAVKPSGRYASLDEAVETLDCAPATLGIVAASANPTNRVAELWGLQPTGNVLTDPLDPAAAPVPGDWIGALSRLSVLLDRSRVDVPILQAIFGTRYLTDASADIALDPAYECKPSRVTVTGLNQEVLDRLQRFLRLRRITGWPIRDTDLVLRAFARPGTAPLIGDPSAIALAHVREIAARTGAPVRLIAAWLGAVETRPYTDREAESAPVLPSLYAEVFLDARLRGSGSAGSAGGAGGAGGADFALDAAGDQLAYLTAQNTANPTYLKLTDRLAYVGAALRLAPAELAGLIGNGSHAVVPDALSLDNLSTLLRQASLARTLGISVRQSRILQRLTGIAPVPDEPPSLDLAGRRILEFLDALDTVRASGLSIDELAWCLVGTDPDQTVRAERRLGQLRWLVELQAALREVQPADGGSGGEADEATLRTLLGTAGWPTGLTDRVIAGEGDQYGLTATPPLEVAVVSANPPAVAGAGPFTAVDAGDGTYRIRLTGVPTAADFGALAQLPDLGPLSDPRSPAVRLQTLVRSLRDRTRSLTRWLQASTPPRLTRPLRFEVPVPRDGQTPRPFPVDGLGTAIRPANNDQIEIDGFLTATDARRLRSWCAGATNETEVRDAIAPLVGVPATLGQPHAPLSYDPVLRGLVLVGYPAAADVPALTSIVENPRYAAAVQALVAASNAYAEQRPSRRLLAPDAVLRLFIEQAAPRQRFAAVQDALVAPLRRQRAVRLLSTRTGVDERLLDALDAAAETMTPPVDIIGAVASDHLLGVVIRDARAEDALSEPLLALDPLDRVGLLIRRLGMVPAEAGWLARPDGFRGLDLLGLATTGAVSLFAEWRRAVTLFELREQLPGGGATLERLRTVQSVDAGLAILANVFDVQVTDLSALQAVDGAVTVDQFRDPMVLRRLVGLAGTLRRLPVPAGTIVALCTAPLDQPAAGAARTLILARSKTAAAAEAAGRLRDRQRASLITYLVYRDRVRDASELHARYLLDVEMGPRLKTSRIKQAIGSAQLYLRRLMLNLEGGTPGILGSLARQSSWALSEQAWGANRRVFLYPENWLEPSLRDDKSHLFRKLEGELLQGDLTTERAIAQFGDYLIGLQEIGRLTVRAMFVHAPSGMVHVLGRTADHPLRFFYRQWTVAETSRFWTPWEPVEAVTNTEHAVCFMRGGRPHIAWLQVGRALDQRGATVDSADWDVELFWCQRTTDGWSAPNKWRNRLRHPVLINKDDRVSFALRVHDHGGVPQLRVYGAVDVNATPRQINPIPLGVQTSFTNRPAADRFTSHRIEVQVAGELSTATGTSYFAMDEAKVEVWGSWWIYYQVTDNGGTGTNTPPWPPATAPKVLLMQGGTGTATLTIPIDIYQVTERWAKVYIRVTAGGVTESFGPIELNPLQNNVVRLGRRYPISPNDPRFLESRPVRLLNIASFGWEHSLGISGGPPGDRGELPVDVHYTVHESSGFREGPLDAAVIWGSNAMTEPTGLRRFFAVGSAGTNRTQHGPPFYIEEADAAAFFVWRGDDTFTLIPAGEYVAGDALTAITAGGETINLGPQDTTSRIQAMLGQLHPSLNVSLAQATSDAQFTLSNPAGTYDWELYFHIPYLVATTFATQQRFGEALRWLHLVFDPTAAGPVAGNAWRFRPFREESSPNIADLLTELARGTLDTARADALRSQIDYWRNHPFQPHGIARMRPRAYQWMVVYKYVEILIAWGDMLFRRDTLESMNEATQLYLLAAQLLGPRPPRLPEPPPLFSPLTYASVADKLDDFSNAWIGLVDLPFFKQWLQFLIWLWQHGYTSPGQNPDLAETIQRLLSTGSLVFCIPANERTETLRSTVEDRLTKIRASQNIDGIARQPALFEPAIDPALFVRATAAGLDIDAVLNDAAAPAPRRRFRDALLRATEFTAEVRALGSQLLAALEKRDGEHLARIRAVDELALLDLMTATRQRELDEASAALDVTRQSRQSALTRYRHYQRLLGKEQVPLPGEQEMLATEPHRLLLAGSSADQLDPQLRGYGLSQEEAVQLDWMTVANTFTLIGGGFQVASGIAHMVPNFTTEWFNQQVTFGGSNVGSGLGAVGQFFSMLAGNASFQANRSAIVGAHQRRYDDWVLQSNLAAREIEQVDKQLIAAEIRVDLARRAVDQHAAQVANARRSEEFLRTKFSNEQLYQWMGERLGQAHSAAFQLAYELAKAAERSLARELGIASPGIIRYGAWDQSHRGLLAAESLSLDLKRLDAAYLRGDERELEITKHLPLSELNPIELLRLRQTGTCTFDVPETVYDMDFPGHYFRRIKSVSVSIPCVIGPYRSAAGTLTLLGSRTRVATASQPYREAQNDPRFVVETGPRQSIATSTGQNDAGLFELNFHDERYLPFERSGAVSRWRFDLPADFRPFDYSTISDLVLHVRYTARDGGESLRAAASTNLRTLIGTAAQAGELVRMVSLRRQHSSVWQRLTAAPDTPQDISIDESDLPYAFRAAGLKIWKVAVFVQGPAGAAITVECPQVNQAGAVVLTPLNLDEDETNDIDGLTRYDATIPTPVPMGASGPRTMWRFQLAEGAEYHDVVVAYWCTG
jgi:hypothetical protein